MVTLKKLFFVKDRCKTSLAVQWLRLCISTAEGVGSIPVFETKIHQATVYNNKKIFKHMHVDISSGEMT